MKHQVKQARDPICGMLVDIDDAVFTSRWMGKDFYFCASGCRDLFAEDPARFAKPESLHQPA